MDLISIAWLFNHHHHPPGAPPWRLAAPPGPGGNCVCPWVPQSPGCGLPAYPAGVPRTWGSGPAPLRPPPPPNFLIGSVKENTVKKQGGARFTGSFFGSFEAFSLFFGSFAPIPPGPGEALMRWSHRGAASGPESAHGSSGTGSNWWGSSLQSQHERPRRSEQWLPVMPTHVARSSKKKQIYIFIFI